ncbi:TetR/AcrR family transcriptional regulator C-terminal domain-containing protein [Amycolatopsis magusensis]|uniref:DNA-binding transcriptional regulator YhcF (GntR family) n=1 Tax=Amycolatopsis magusensis TaxID=882444 RepID=A0ABS4PHU7_9PSEU|nr:TetR/AcrR family transcriptional regulator C-terminal domain-containing protein [Amycolatopsis magusensis]MBP2178965.1 DNA-binding transcriptional regulator YhcF (GntR family) [Amycolatopsis magusensis]
MPDPPYRRIVNSVQARIAAGELRAGDRMPSIRRVAEEWGVAVATATKAMAILRDAGLLETRVGSGTVVSARAGQRRRESGEPVPGREQLVRTAIRIADTEGLDAVSMRRLGTELGVGPMSLYRQVAGKDELVAQMADAVFGEPELPDPGPDGWRAKLELVSRLLWQLTQRHHWLPRVISFTRPLLLPNAMAYTEWTLRALDGLGLSAATRAREAIILPALVITTAMSRAAEIEAEQDTGETFDLWWLARENRTSELMHSGAFPLLATIPHDVVADLDGLFEHALTRHLDGLATTLPRESHTQEAEPHVQNVEPHVQNVEPHARSLKPAAAEGP